MCCCYNFNLIKYYSCYKHNVVYSKFSWLFKVLTDDDVKYFVVIIFCEYFKSVQEKLYSKQRKEQNLRKAAEVFYVFLT